MDTADEDEAKLASQPESDKPDEDEAKLASQPESDKPDEEKPIVKPDDEKSPVKPDVEMTVINPDELVSEPFDNKMDDHSSGEENRSVANKFHDYYDLPCQRMIYGDINFPILNETVRIKGNNVCLRIVFADPPPGTKPDRRHCLQIQLSFTHIQKFMFLAPESNNGATAIALAISDVAVLRLNGALCSATGQKLTGHPSRRYIFFDLLFNNNDPMNKTYWTEVLRYISQGFNLQVHRKLLAEKQKLSEKDYLELEKNLKVANVVFIRKEQLLEILKFSNVTLEVIPDKNGHDRIIFQSNDHKPAEKRKEPPHITINDISIPKLNKSDIIQQESASGRIEFNFDDLALLKPNAWLNDKIVDWYCYHLLKLVPEEKRKRIRLCETYFYTSLTKGIENETNPTNLKAGIYRNYDPKKFKHSFFDYDFIVVPIHRLNHWFLVVIVDPKVAITFGDSTAPASENAASLQDTSHTDDAPKTEDVPRTEDAPLPRCHFLIFDSFKKLATDEHDISFDHLTYFLARHYDDVKSNLAASDTFNRGLVDKVFPKEMPQQTNADDCGVFSLMFLKYFFDHLPDGNALPDFAEWWKTFSIQGMRDKIHAEIITTAINYEEIKRRHENDPKDQPLSKKPKMQMHPNQQIYRISLPSNFARPIGNAPITFRPRAPTSTRAPSATRLQLVPPPIRAPTRARRARGASAGPRNQAGTKRGSRKSAAASSGQESSSTSTEKEASVSAEKTETEAETSSTAKTKSKEPFSNESLNATYASMGLQASDDESS